MSDQTPRATLRRRTDTALIVIFLALIWLPTADTFLHLDRTAAPTENRTPARFPEFQRSLRGAREFFAGLDSYFSDHFGFRKRLVRWEQRWKWQIFRDSKSSTAIAGRNGWLYFSGGMMIEDVMGSRPFTEAELRNWRELLTGRRDWLAERGIRYLFVLAPDKHTIYPEHLPEWLAAAARPQRRRDQFVNYMSANSDVPILDLRDTLLTEKKIARVYRPTDTHWNDRGAFAAYRRIVQRLSSRDTPLAPLDLSEFQTLTVDRPAGDLARMLGWEGFLNENGTLLIEPRAHLPLIPPRAEAIADRQWIPGTEPQVTENPTKTGRVVMFRDSFASLLIKFLGYDFNRVVYLWRQNWDKELIERERPDIVIDEMIERSLISRDPAELKIKDDQPAVQVFGER